LTEQLAVEAMCRDDWDAVREIYGEGIAGRLATFETEVPDYPEWNRSHRPDCRLVVRLGGRAVGWAALSPVSTRACYSGVAEVSVYVAAAAQSRGVGRLLLTRLIEESERAGLWTLQAGIFPENVASVAMHRGCGFDEVGVRRRIGRLDGVWKDVVLMERRSSSVGD
jgi:phosphinothricin acetyltransferase